MKMLKKLFRSDRTGKDVRLIRKIYAILTLPIFLVQMTSVNLLFAPTSVFAAEEALVSAPAEVITAVEQPKVEPTPAEETPVVESAPEVVAPVIEKVEKVEPTIEPVAEKVIEAEAPVVVSETLSDPVDTTIPEVPAIDPVAASIEKEIPSASSADTFAEKSANVETWSVDGDKAVTNANVELGKTYTDPQNKDVSVTFTKLPENSGTLSIEEVTLTADQVSTLGAISNKAYDITSSMENGTFEYDLTLPKPANQENVQIKFAETEAGLENAETVATSDVSASGDSVSASLDHFTIFVVTDNDAVYAPNPWIVWGVGGYAGSGFHYTADPQADQSATWTFSDITSGSYKVYVSWSTHSNRTTSAPYTLNYNGGGISPKNINQEQLADQTTTGAENQWSGWHNYGTYNLNTSSNLVLKTVDNTSGTDYVVADEVLLVPDTAPNEVWINSSYNVNFANDNHVWGYDAFATIQEGIAAVATSGTVNVAAGTYNENISINKQISLLGADKNTTIIDGGNSGVVVTIVVNNVTLSGFTIKNSGPNPLTEAGIGLNGANDCNINGNVVMNNITGIAIMSSTGNAINNNTISNSLMYGIVLEAGAPGFYSTGNIISENIINANGRDGIYAGEDNNNNQILNNEITGTSGDSAYGAPEGNGIYFWKSASNTVTGNNISSNTTGYGIEMYGSKSNTITNNIITGNQDGFHIRNIDEEENPGYSIKGNIISGNKIHDNTRVNLYGSPNFDFSIENNWWGSADEATIKSKLASWDASGDVVNGTTVFLDYTPWCMNYECTIFSSANAITVAASGITPTDAILNGTNGNYDATGHSFWVSLNTFNTSDLTPRAGLYWTDGIGNVNANDSFSIALSSVKQSSDATSIMVTPGTTYYFVAWSEVGGTWYPGDVLNFTTAQLEIPTNMSPADGVNITTANLNEIDWSDVTYSNTPVSYFYQSSLSATLNPADGSFASPAYTSEELSVSETPASNTPQGIYYWHVRAQDNAGNSSAWSTPWSIVVDNTAPVITINSYNTSWTKNNITVTASTNEGTLNTTSHQFTINGSFDFVATDTAGNITTETVAITNIDKQKPSKPVITSPVANGYINSATQTFTWNPSVDPTPGSGLAVADTYQYQIDNNSGFGSPEKDWSVNTTTWTLTNPLPDGTYYVRVRAKDAVGNNSVWSTAVKFYIDTISPTVPTNGAPHNTSVVTNEFDFTWDASFDVSTVTYEYQASLNPAEASGVLITAVWPSGVLPSNSIHSSGASDGKWYWQARALDAAGNASAWSAILNVTIDTQVPVVTLIGDATVTLQYGDTYSEQGATWTDNVDGSGTVTAGGDVVDTLTLGEYHVTYNKTDAAGNIAVQKTRTVTVVPRAIEITADAQSKIYGDADPVLTYQITNGSLVEGDDFLGILERAIGENVGIYAIGQGTVDLSTNYVLTYVGSNFEITKANTETVVTCSAEDQVYTGSEITPCTVSVTGANLELSPTPTYENNVNVGTASASYTYEGDANHNGSGNSATFEIVKATSSVTVVCPGEDQEYTGSAIEACTASYSGAGELSGLLIPTYTDNIIPGTATASAAYDGDPNHFGSSDSATFEIVDTVISEVSLAIDPATPNGDNDWYDSKPTVTLSAVDNYLVDRIEYQLNGTAGAWTTYTVPFVLEDGQWQVYYRSFDSSGNVSVVGLKDAKVDTINPDNVNNFDAEYQQDRARVQLTWDVNDDDIEQVYIYRGTSKNFSVNSGSRITRNDRNDNDLSDEKITLGEKYYYKVVTIDEAGNKSGVKVISVTMPAEVGGVAVVTNEEAETLPEGTVLGVETDNGNQQAEPQGTVKGTNDEITIPQQTDESFNWWWLIVIALGLSGWFGYRKFTKGSNV